MANEDGSAALEFITVGVILLIPLVYLVIALGTIQQQMLGVEAASRHTVRAIALADDAGTAAAEGAAVLAHAVTEYGIDPDAVELSMNCVPEGVPCPSAGAIVTVTVSTRVALPLIPSLLGLDRAASVGVEGVAVQKMSRLWGEG